MIRFINILLAFLIAHSAINAQSSFALGADVGWLTEMEKSGRKFFTSDGQEKECMQLLKENTGMNAIRLRVWVNPVGEWNGLADVLLKAKRAHALGMRLMIDFHYSDTWADPGHQTKPAAWSAMTFTQLKQAVYDHTYLVLDTLRNHGVIPEWVQVGNETGNGMLWEDGKASVSMPNYAQLTTSGYNAVKAISQNIKVIVHLHNGYDNSLFRWIFDGLKNNGGKWDVIGMSLYPSWYTTANDWVNANKACLTNMNDMVTRYGKEVMIVECGMSWDSAEASKNFLTDLIAKTKSVTGGKGLGVFYWEPQSYGNWKGYSLGAFEQVSINGVIGGRPTKALDAFKLASSVSNISLSGLKYEWHAGLNQIRFNTVLDRLNIFNTNGIFVDSLRSINAYSFANLQNGTYILEAVYPGGTESFKWINN